MEQAVVRVGETYRIAHKANQYGSTIVGREFRTNAHGFRKVVVVCSCGTETIQRAMDANADFCGRCGYLSDHNA